MFGPWASLPAAAVMNWLTSPGVLVAVLIVLASLLVGLGDMLRLSPRRVWAISSVSFAESIRRRVLWITPLAIVGILAVVQFLDPLDPADAIRQTTKVCLFATGLIVTVLAIILACTNLPKEIESRVIYTVVTKPTTRLEIVLGKVLGFARVSGTVLLIMGAFTLAYLHLKAWRAESWVREQAAANPGDPVLQNLSRTRLLATRSLARPQLLNVYARPPVDAPPSLAGGQSQYYALTFALTPQQKDDIIAALKGGTGGLFFINTLGYEQRIPTSEEQKTIRDMRLPTTETEPGWAGGGGGTPLLPGVPSALNVALPIPQIQINLYDRNFNTLVDEQKDKPVNNGQSLMLPPGGDEPKPLPAFLSPTAVERMLEVDSFNVLVEASTPTVTYVIGTRPTILAYVSAPGQEPKKIDPVAPDDLTKPGTPRFLSHRARYGLQVRGKANGQGSVAGFAFRGASVPEPGPDGNVILETRIGIESATDFETEANIVPRMNLTVFNHESGSVSPPVPVAVESGRITRTPVPAQYLRGGNFDVYLAGLNEGMWYGIEETGVNVVRAQGSFAANLARSLLILWLMSVLVVVVAVFTSTFLSWPIAVVLTVVILGGHWGVEQLGDAGGAQIGQEVTQTMQVEDPTAARIMRTSVGALASTLTFLSAFLPDVSKFAATDDIERGVSIPARTLKAAGWVLLAYGGPVLLLSYLILRRKEVAP